MIKNHKMSTIDGYNRNNPMLDYSDTMVLPASKLGLNNDEQAITKSAGGNSLLQKLRKRKSMEPYHFKDKMRSINVSSVRLEGHQSNPLSLEEITQLV
jgi:hypothetical protein